MLAGAPLQHVLWVVHGSLIIIWQCAQIKRLSTLLRMHAAVRRKHEHDLTTIDAFAAGIQEAHGALYSATVTARALACRCAAAPSNARVRCSGGLSRS
jgi:hypothetical protein